MILVAIECKVGNVDDVNITENWEMSPDSRIAWDSQNIICSIDVKLILLMIST